MATEGCLPVFHTGGDAGQDEVDLETVLAQDPILQDDHLLSELLRSEGDDILASLLEPTGAQSLLAPLDFDLSTSPLLSSRTASDGYASDHSAAQNTASPSSHSSVSDHWGESPPCVISSTLPDSQPLLDVQGVAQPSDVSIDVDLIFRDAVSTVGAPTSQEPTVEAPTSQEPTCGGGKAATLVLSEEEKALLAQEGIELPVDMPLTKAEQKHLKRVRRKIKNKVSAQESRKRKKDYVQGLERRVEHCTTVNRELQRKVGTLETENRSLLAQLQKLQALVSQYHPSRMKTGSLVLVVILSFSLFLAPWLQPAGRQRSGYLTVKAHSSRTLLFAETDEYGNVIDPETGQVISEAGGQSPLPAPPWVHQTPALHLLHRHSHDQKLRHDL